MALETFSSKARSGETHIEAVQERFPGAIKSVEWIQDYQPVVTVDRDRAPEVIEFLYYDRGGWMPVMVGNDERSLRDCYALYYVLSMEETDTCVMQVRVEVDPKDLTFKSVSPRVPAAVWPEREVQDMFGLKAEGIIDNRNLVLPDDWPQGLYPLRKDTMDYRYRPEPTTDVENYQFLKETGDRETTTIPMGPMHITSDEPGHFRLYVDGETIVDADYRMFFIHRGMEKVAESRLNYDQVPFLAERVCGICGFAHSTAYAETIERSQGIEVPLRAEYIRAIILETERLHSHLLNLGLVCHYSGFDTGFQHFFRVREKSMDLAEMLTGARKTYGLNLIGGVRRDILFWPSRNSRRFVTARLCVTRLNSWSRSFCPRRTSRSALPALVFSTRRSLATTARLARTSAAADSHAMPVGCIRTRATSTSRTITSPLRRIPATSWAVRWFALPRCSIPSTSSRSSCRLTCPRARF